MTASKRKIERIVSSGEIPEIESSYERTKIIRGLKDYLGHTRSTELVQERAQNAVEQLTDSQEGEQ